MKDKLLSDLHCHLNGSYSMEFLKQTAIFNQCIDTYEELIMLKKEYQEKTSERPNDGYPKEVIAMIWKQFSLIHKIIQNNKDIRLGVIDVAKNCQAGYVEIRSTPKRMGEHSVADYINSFEQGLRLAASDDSIATKAYGLLSLDRVHADFDTAKAYIDRVIKSDVLIGIDISGNPEEPKRSLVGDDLRRGIDYALNNGVGVGIHMGESDGEHEHRDTETILLTLEEWAKEHAGDLDEPFAGRIRLGHCIYLNDDHKQRIAKLKLPIEVCPTCHSHLNWHPKDKPHPASLIYPNLPAPIASGTDDKNIFNSGALPEMQKSYSFFAKPKEMTEQTFMQMQHKYRFHPPVQSKLLPGSEECSPVTCLLS